MTDNPYNLDLLLDIVIPGDAAFPPASAIGLTQKLEAHDRFGPTSQAALSLLPPNFAERNVENRNTALLEIEAAHPEVFTAFITGVYSLYYSDIAVLAAIASTTGYTPHAPQPQGYALDPFDPAILETVAGRSRQYRDIGDN